MSTEAEYEANVAARLERERLVPHVGPCDEDGCYCPDDVFWARMLGDDDPCAPGKDWVAAAFAPAARACPDEPADVPGEVSE